MALTYDVCETSDTSYSSSSDGNFKTGLSVQRSWRVIVTDPADNEFTGAKVSEAQVACNAGGLPRVGQTAYYHPLSGTSIPFAVCKSLTIDRDESNRALFYVQATYSTEPTEGSNCDQQNNLGLPSSISVAGIPPMVDPTIQMREVVVYQDADGNECFVLPTGSPYETPMIEMVPLLTLKIQQVEASITYEQMLARSYVINSTAYRTKQPGYWMTGAVKAVPYTVQLTTGPSAAARVTYEVTLMERQILNDVGATETVGWVSTQPLVDTVHKDLATGKLSPFQTLKTGINFAGRINKTGETIDGANTPSPGGPPYHLKHRIQKAVPFLVANGGFLQV